MKRTLYFLMAATFVLIYWSDALAQSSVKVPSVVGMSRDQAQKTLQNAGFKLAVKESIVYDKNQHDKVGSQNPSANFPRSKGTTVTLTVYRYNGPRIGPITSPRGGDIWQAGTAQTIKWTSAEANIYSTLALKLYKGGTYLYTISTGTFSNAYDWRIPSDTRPGNDYKISISGVQDNRYDCMSEQPFAISGAAKATPVPVAASTKVVVPSVIGKNILDAEGDLVRSLGLKAERIQKETPDKGQQGKVIDQTPAAGQPVDKGSTIKLTYLLYRQVGVPELRGMYLDRVEPTLQKAGLKAKLVSQTVADGSAHRVVISQDPPAVGKMVDPGSTVTVVYGIFRAPAPNVIGMSNAKADAALQGKGFHISWSDVPTKDESLDLKIASQDPKPGQTVEGETPVKLSVYRFGVQVPNVVGMTLDAAKESLKQARHNAVVEKTLPTKDDKQGGKVASQSPAADGKWLFGTTERTVKLTVYDAMPVVPNVVGMTPVQAQQTIKQANLTAVTKDSEFQRVKDKNLHGKVAGQDPAAGQKAVKGSSVSLTLYNALPPIPSVTGTDYENAKKILEKAGYRAVKAKDELPAQDFIWSGKVARQNPVSGELRMGGDVLLTCYETLPQAVLPKVVGLSYDQALQVLAKAGFTNVTTRRTLVDDPKLAAGIIETQDVAAGTKVFTAERILLTGRRYEPRASVKVPNVLNMTVDEAGKTIQNAGLFYGIGYKDTGLQESNGRIVSQSPAPGTTAFAKSSVDLVAGRYSAAAIEVNMIYVAANKTYLLKIKGGMQPYDVKADYSVPAADQKILGGAKALEILGLKDEPSSPGWKFYRVIAKIPMKATFTVKDAKGTTKPFIATMENK